MLATGPSVFGLDRSSPDGTVRVRALHNISAEPVRVPDGAAPGTHEDLISGAQYRGGDIRLAPYQSVWLRPLG